MSVASEGVASEGVVSEGVVEATPEATARASVARLIAHFLLCEIDEDGLRTLLQPDVLEILEKLEPGCAEYLEGDWHAADFEQAAVDYCSLFVLPKGAPPFASAWLGGTPHEHGPRLLALIRQVAGRLEIDLGFENLPADHLGLVLSLWAEAVEREASEAAAIVEVELLQPVVHDFCRAARDGTQNVFYRGMASLLDQLFRG